MDSTHCRRALVPACRDRVPASPRFAASRAAATTTGRRRRRRRALRCRRRSTATTIHAPLTPLVGASDSATRYEPSLVRPRPQAPPQCALEGEHPDRDRDRRGPTPGHRSVLDATAPIDTRYQPSNPTPVPMSAATIRAKAAVPRPPASGATARRGCGGPSRACARPGWRARCAAPRRVERPCER